MNDGIGLSCITLSINMTFQRGQLDDNVHIDQGGWLF